MKTPGTFSLNWATFRTEKGEIVFDAHLHIIDPRFPLVDNQGFRPETFTVADYQARVTGLGVTGGAVVAGSYQGHDPAPIVAALNTLGPMFIGVAQLPPDTSDDELQTLHEAGIRALRFNLRRETAGDTRALFGLARRAAKLWDWPAEFYIDSHQLPAFADELARLSWVSVDHLGLSEAGIPALLELVAAGARVKATGFGRGDLDVVAAMRAIAEVNPYALMFGTDLPSTRAARPFEPADRELVTEALGAKLAERAFSVNARQFYGITEAGERTVPAPAPSE